MPKSGGEGIRTPDRDSPMPVFKTGAFNRSATPPVETAFYPVLWGDEWLLLEQSDHGPASASWTKRRSSSSSHLMRSAAFWMAFSMLVESESLLDEEAVIGFTHR